MPQYSIKEAISPDYFGSPTDLIALTPDLDGAYPDGDNASPDLFTTSKGGDAAAKVSDGLSPPLAGVLTTVFTLSRVGDVL